MIKMTWLDDSCLDRALLSNKLRTPGDLPIQTNTHHKHYNQATSKITSQVKVCYGLSERIQYTSLRQKLVSVKNSSKNYLNFFETSTTVRYNH